MNAPLAPSKLPRGLDRRALLKSGGALVIGFSLAGAGAAARAQDALHDAPERDAPGPPDNSRIDTWIAIHADNTATVFIGFVELGQGNTTALPQVAAEELDLGMDQIRTVQHDTNVTPFQFGTYSSASIAFGRPQVQAAAAEARQALLNLAAERLGAPASELQVARGVVSVAGDASRSVTYGELLGGKLFDLAFTGTAPTKPPAEYAIAGTPIPRRDIPSKAAGTYEYVQHVRLEGMLHGRVVRPRGQRAFGEGAKITRVDETSIAHIPGARMLRRGDFLAVVAPKEWDAVRAARDLAVVWETPAPLPADDLYGHMRAQPAEVATVEERGDADAAFADAAAAAEMTIETPYQCHATFAPNCAVADVRGDSALVIAPSQDIYALRRSLAPLLDLPETSIRVRYADSAGTYGHSCYDDAGQAAAVASQLAGAPVRLQFMRWDEHGWDPFGPAHVGEVRVAADADGMITGYQYDGWQHSWLGAEVTQQLAMGTPASTWPFGPSRSVNPAVCGGSYAIENLKLVDHQLPGEPYFRAGWLRSPLDLAFAFASEQAIDDLAFQRGEDPVAFRRRNIADERWLGVLEAATEAAGWVARPAASELARGDVARGRGVGLGTHLAGWGGAVAEVEVDWSTGAVRITRLYGAIDAGLAVNPGNVEAQIMGQLVQLASRMLHEEVTFDETSVTSLDWSTYPILRFEECPDVTAVVVQRIDQPSSGAGEEVMAAAAAAVANAFFDATGVRMATFPFTPDRVLTALARG